MFLKTCWRKGSELWNIFNSEVVIERNGFVQEIIDFYNKSWREILRNRWKFEGSNCKAETINCVFNFQIQRIYSMEARAGKRFHDSDWGKTGSASQRSQGKFEMKLKLFKSQPSQAWTTNAGLEQYNRWTWTSVLPTLKFREKSRENLS